MTKNRQTYDALEVARHIINHSNIHRYGISNLKLQKVLYFVQAYFLITPPHTPCFNDVIEAWDFGPVVPSVYYEYKQYGSGNIPYIKSYILFDKKNIWNTVRVPYRDNRISDNDKELIHDIVDQLAPYSATYLVQVTHNQTPWKKAFQPKTNKEITLASIKEYFNAKAKQH